MRFETAFVLSVFSAVSLARPLAIYPREALDTGSCGSPAIEFADGLDGRNEPSFQAVNQADFSHGSALNIGVISDFICGQLASKCKASASTVSTCQSASTAAKALTGQAAADSFNSALGVSAGDVAGSSNASAANANAADGGVANASATNAGTANADAADAGTANADAADAGTANANASDAGVADANATGAGVANANATNAGVANANSGDAAENLQAFTGALGAGAPGVTASGDQFQVDGNAAFNNLQNALVRSCDVQHNQCADAANSSGNSGALTVAACGDQQTACNAQAQSTAASAT